MSKKIIHFVSRVCIVGLLVFIPLVSIFAQDTRIPVGGAGTGAGSVNCQQTICNPFKGGDDLFSLITTILNNIVMPIAVVGIVFWIIYAGFQFVIANGKPADLEKAKKNLLWSLIGAGILLGAAGISAVVQKTVEELLK